jgi:hypothetical protein
VNIKKVISSDRLYKFHFFGRTVSSPFFIFIKIFTGFYFAKGFGLGMGWALAFQLCTAVYPHPQAPVELKKNMFFAVALARTVGACRNGNEAGSVCRPKCGSTAGMQTPARASESRKEGRPRRCAAGKRPEETAIFNR